MSSPPPKDLKERFLLACLEQIKIYGWSGFRVQNAAYTLQLSVEQAAEIFPDEQAVLSDFQRHLINETLAAIPLFSESDTQKDRLFEALMIHFEVMTPHKDLLKELWEEILSLSPQLPTLAEGTFIFGEEILKCVLPQSQKPTPLQLMILTYLYARLFHRWLHENDPDQEGLMVFMDEQLNILGGSLF